MFCPQCGASNADNAAVCAQCGRTLQASAVAPLPVTGVVIPPGTTVPNYLVFSILATVLCCIPAGIPAIVYSAQVNSKLLQGDLAGAQAASSNAKKYAHRVRASALNRRSIFGLRIAREPALKSGTAST